MLLIKQTQDRKMKTEAFLKGQEISKQQGGEVERPLLALTAEEGQQSLEAEMTRNLNLPSSLQE